MMLPRKAAALRHSAAAPAVLLHRHRHERRCRLSMVQGFSRYHHPRRHGRAAKHISHTAGAAAARPRIAQHRPARAAACVSMAPPAAPRAENAAMTASRARRGAVCAPNRAPSGAPDAGRQPAHAPRKNVETQSENHTTRPNSHEIASLPRASVAGDGRSPFRNQGELRESNPRPLTEKGRRRKGGKGGEGVSSPISLPISS